MQETSIIIIYIVVIVVCATIMGNEGFMITYCIYIYIGNQTYFSALIPPHFLLFLANAGEDDKTKL